MFKYIRDKKLILILIFILAFALRFYKLSSNPPSLYWEEVALGYDAYSLLKTGKDHRDNQWPIVYLESFMDYKPPLYAYTAIPSILIFGLNEVGVRFPSAFFGTLTVVVFYLLLQELFKEDKSQLIPLVATFLISISPWHLQFCRAAFEANLSLFLVLSGVLLFIKAVKHNKFKLYLLFSAVFFSLSLYTYHGTRIFVPLILLILVLSYFKKLLKLKIIVAFSLIIGLVLSFPLVQSFSSKEVGQRFQETSAFATLEPIIESNKKIEEDGESTFSRLIHHRFFEYSNIFLNNYFKHFNGTYLFISGDTNPRHSTQEFGLLYHWELISLILGVVYLFKDGKKERLLILGWILITPVAASITKAVPHSLRTIFGIPAFIIISTLGLVQLFKIIKNNKYYNYVVYLLVIFIFFEFVLYLHFYYHHYPKLYSSDWQYGYKEAVDYIKDNQDKYDSIYLTNEHGRAYMYYLFYTQMEPDKAQELIMPYKDIPDIAQIGKVAIGMLPEEQGKQLFIGTEGEISDARLLKTINLLNGKTAFQIWEK